MSVELYFLGAGKPMTGDKPSALKNIVMNYKAMDWQLHSFESLVETENTYFIGGYHIDEVVKSYPELHFSIVADWKNKNALDSLFYAPFSGNPVVISYTDTLFRKGLIEELINSSNEVTFVIDSLWRERYASRSREDILKAETLTVNQCEVEFTGLVYLGTKAVSHIQEVIQAGRTKLIGNELLDLISFFRDKGLKVDFKDVAGDWAEFNSPSDIANFVLGTKADTLARLEHIVQKSHIGKQESFTTELWRNEPDTVISRIQANFGETKLVVRSSSKSEDNWRSSNAGGFESILNVSCFEGEELREAINKVVDSYGYPSVDSDQVLVQEFLQNVAMAGVVFTCTLESGAPYYRFNFDDSTQSTESVTAGTHSDLRTVLVSKLRPTAIKHIAPELHKVLQSVQELEQLLGFDKLDIEFAVDLHSQVHIFQVRPVVVNHDNYELDISDIEQSVQKDIERYHQLQKNLPFIGGTKTLFANMPDWNPAEIIGTRPKPLAFSLYQHLITNDVWAQQRSEFGYIDVRPHPLIVSFSGHPYVDVRASLNSFIPNDIPKDTLERIVNAYILLLSDNPHFHDKIEFDVAFTIWTPDFENKAKKRLLPYGVFEKDIDLLGISLKNITCNALTSLDSHIGSIKTLSTRYVNITDSKLDNIDKIYALLDDCKRLGTLAFSHAARAGFVASIFLKYFVSSGTLTEERRLSFLNSFDTVAGEFEKDKSNYLTGIITQEQLVNKYGHLRPGTYEITTEAYWEDPQQYIIPTKLEDKDELSQPFEFDLEEKQAFSIILNSMGSDISVESFIAYLVKATQERERVKFEFTRNLSKALDLCTEFGQELNISREDMAFLTYSDLEQLKVNMLSETLLVDIICSRKQEYKLNKVIELPSLIDSPAQFYSFERFSSLPNFIGVGRVFGDLVIIDKNSDGELTDKIVMIPQADPGYDWLFSHNIKGLITLYGGANSHMAIRAAEIALPAAIGVGEKLYESLIDASRVELDCINHTIRII